MVEIGRIEGEAARRRSSQIRREKEEQLGEAFADTNDSDQSLKDPPSSGVRRPPRYREPNEDLPTKKKEREMVGEQTTEAQKAELRSEILRSEAEFVTSLLEEAQRVCQRMASKDPMGAFVSAEYYIDVAISELGMK